MGNKLTCIPLSLLGSSTLQQLNLADNALTEVPTDWSAMVQLQAVWLYGNLLTRLPETLARLPILRSVWLENNPLSTDSTAAFLAAAFDGTSLMRIGLDTTQLPANWLDSSSGACAVLSDKCKVAAKVKVGVIKGGGGQGYFK